MHIWGEPSETFAVVDSKLNELLRRVEIISKEVTACKSAQQHTLKEFKFLREDVLADFQIEINILKDVFSKTIKALKDGSK